MRKLDSLEQSIVNENSYSEMFLHYQSYLNGGYIVTAKRYLELIEWKLLRDSSDYQIMCKFYKETKDLNNLADVNQRLILIQQMLICVVNIKNSKLGSEKEEYVKNIFDVVEEYEEIVTFRKSVMENIPK